MTLREGWSPGELEGEPAAACVGPFPRRGFVEAWWRHRGAGRLLIADAGESRLPLWDDGEMLRIAGEEDLTDYHAPLGGGPDDAAVLGEVLGAAMESGTRFRFDSLPAEVAVPLGLGLSRAGIEVVPVEHEVAAVLELPGSHDEYLSGLRGKDRHEIRRKGRRFADGLGEPRLVRGGAEDLPVFFEMHRAAPGRKGRFMTPGMEEFFADLLALDGAVLWLLKGEGSASVAAAFGFEDPDAFYLYNSAYDPDNSPVSPGVVLVDRLIDAAIGSGRRWFDFLKGDESYKFRMGARRRPLLVLEGWA